jgi:hypothetical protein
MARKRYAIDEKTIARFQKQGRGEGAGAEYRPWLQVQDVPSTGRVRRASGRVTGRIHHLLSDIEWRAFLIYDWGDDTVDIREQFPLNRDETRRLASALGIRHPADTQTRTDTVMTTNLVIDVRRAGGVEMLARTVKTSGDLDARRTREKLLIERDYWVARGVDWGVVTERDIPKALTANLDWLRAFHDANKIAQLRDGSLAEIAGIIAIEATGWPDAPLKAFCTEMDARFGLEAGVGLLIARHLLATKAWRTDMTVPITETSPMRRFAVAPAAQRRSSA